MAYLPLIHTESLKKAMTRATCYPMAYTRKGAEPMSTPMVTLHIKDMNNDFFRTELRANAELLKLGVIDDIRVVLTILDLLKADIHFEFYEFIDITKGKTLLLRVEMNKPTRMGRCIVVDLDEYEYATCYVNDPPYKLDIRVPFFLCISVFCLLIYCLK